MQALVEESINPAMRRYRDYLANEYLDAARAELSITANPDGLECYEALLRYYTTLDRSGAVPPALDHHPDPVANVVDIV